MKMSNHFFRTSIIALVLNFAFVTIHAQTTSTSTNTSTTTIVSETTDDDDHHSSSRSDYIFSSSFDKKATESVKNYLMKKLGNPSVDSSKRTTRWNTIDGEEIENFKVKLSRGKVFIKYFSNEEDDDNNKEIAKIAIKVSQIISEESGRTTLRFSGDMEF